MRTTLKEQQKEIQNLRDLVELEKGKGQKPIVKSTKTKSPSPPKEPKRDRTEAEKMEIKEIVWEFQQMSDSGQ